MAPRRRFLHRGPPSVPVGLSLSLLRGHRILRGLAIQANALVHNTVNGAGDVMAKTEPTLHVVALYGLVYEWAGEA